MFFILYTLCTQAFSTAGSLYCNAKQPTELTAVEVKGENASHYSGKKRKRKINNKERLKVPPPQENPKRSAKMAKLGDV